MRRRVPLREPIGVALETLRAHKLRSFLMSLGIILSVSTLIVVIALIVGVNRYIADRVANLGLNVSIETYSFPGELSQNVHEVLVGFLKSDRPPPPLAMCVQVEFLLNWLSWLRRGRGVRAV